MIRLGRQKDVEDRSTGQIRRRNGIHGSQVSRLRCVRQTLRPWSWHCPERWTASESHRSTAEYDKDRDLGTNSKTITVNWRLNWASNTKMSPLDGGTRILESNRQTLGDSTLAVFVLLLSCPNGNRFITSFYLPCSRASYYRLAFCPPVTASADVLVPSR